MRLLPLRGPPRQMLSVSQDWPFSLPKVTTWTTIWPMSASLELSAAGVAMAADRLRAVVRRTPLERSERLSEDLGTAVWLKREDLQIARSYKVRGAYNLISSLSAAERRQGVVCASAG